MEVGVSEEPVAPAQVAPAAAAPQPAPGAASPVAPAPPQQQASSPTWLYVDPTVPTPPEGVKPVVSQQTVQAQSVVAEKTNNGGKTAVLTGTVSDPTGAVVPGATVTVSGTSGFKQTVSSNDKGGLRGEGVAAGILRPSGGCAKI